MNPRTHQSITAILEENGYIQARDILATSLLIPKLQIIGFIPEQQNLKPLETYRNSMSELSLKNDELELMYNFNSNIIVNSYRIRIEGAKRTLAVMTNIEKLPQGECTMDNDSINVNNVSSPIKIIGKSFSTVVLSHNLIKEEEAEKNIVKYKADGSLYQFSREIGNYKIIASSFICLCRYINSVTGLPSYILLSPQEVYKIREPENNE